MIQSSHRVWSSRRYENCQDSSLNGDEKSRRRSPVPTVPNWILKSLVAKRVDKPVVSLNHALDWLNVFDYTLSVSTDLVYVWAPGRIQSLVNGWAALVFQGAYTRDVTVVLSTTIKSDNVIFGWELLCGEVFSLRKFGVLRDKLKWYKKTWKFFWYRATM